MEVFNEKVAYENPLLSLKIVQSQRNHDVLINWHYHREIELLLVNDGILDVYIDDDADVIRLKTGDVAIIGARQLHRDRSLGSPLKDRKSVV